MYVRVSLCTYKQWQIGGLQALEQSGIVRVLLLGTVCYQWCVRPLGIQEQFYTQFASLKLHINPTVYPDALRHTHTET